MDESLRIDFIDGVNEVYSTLFNDGESSGIYFYELSDKTVTSIYGESKYKTYKQPKLLVAKVFMSDNTEDSYVKTNTKSAKFSVPYKSLVEKNSINVDTKNLENLCRGKIKYKDTYYDIQKITPSTFVFDTFMIYSFDCVEDKETIELVLEEVIE